LGGGVSELLRYGIPGWLLIVFVGGFLGVRALAEMHLAGTPMSISQAISLHEVDITAVTVFGAAAGLPIGFVVYQLHWWLAEHGAPFIGWIPLDRGAAALYSVPVPFKELIARPYEGPVDASYRSGLLGLVHWKPKPKTSTRKAMLRFQDNQTLAHFVWYLLLQKNKAEIVQKKAEGLADVFHSLGAARVALICAFVVYLLIELFTQVWSHAHFFALVANLLISITFFHIFTAARENTLVNLVLLQRDFITYYWPRTDLEASPEDD
jgi:hypothetical protein